MSCALLVAIVLLGVFMSSDLQILLVGFLGSKPKARVEPPAAETKAVAAKIEGPPRCRCGVILRENEKRLCRSCDDDEADLFRRHGHE